MLRYLLFLLLTCQLVACSNQEQELIEQITTLENKTQKVATDSRYTDDQLRSLLTLYVQYIQSNPGKERSALYTYRIAEVYYRVSGWLECVRHLHMVEDQYPNSPIKEQALALAGIVYDERLHNEAKAKEVYEKYLQLYPNGQHIEQAKNFFRSPIEKLTNRIEQLEMQMQKEGGDARTAALLLHVYKSFALTNPTDSRTPDYCMKGAKLASGMGESFAALELYNIIETNFPNFGDMPYVYFLSAMEYSDRAPLQWQQYLAAQRPFNNFAAQFRNVDRSHFLKQAEKYYKLFLQKFPNHALAQDVKLSLANLGKSDNEIVNSFLQKEQKMNSKSQ